MKIALSIRPFHLSNSMKNALAYARVSTKEQHACILDFCARVCALKIYSLQSQFLNDKSTIRFQRLLCQ